MYVLSYYTIHFKKKINKDSKKLVFQVFALSIMTLRLPYPTIHNARGK